MQEPWDVLNPPKKKQYLWLLFASFEKYEILKIISQTKLLGFLFLSSIFDISNSNNWLWFSLRFMQKIWYPMRFEYHFKLTRQ